MPPLPGQSVLQMPQHEAMIGAGNKVTRNWRLYFQDVQNALAGVPLQPQFGGTGVANTGTIAIGGNLKFQGAFATTFTVTGVTNVTLPTSGTLVTTANAVTSLTGTAHEIAASASVGSVILSLDGPHAFTTLAANGVLYGNGTSPILALAVNATATSKYLQQVSSGAPGWTQVTDADLSLSNISTNDVSTAAHGFAPILPNNSAKFLDGTGHYTTPILTLVAQTEGTDSTAVATNVATIGITGLTAKDTLIVVLTHSSSGAQTSAPELYNSTDSVRIVQTFAALTANTFANVLFMLTNDPQATTDVLALGVDTTGMLLNNPATGSVRGKSTGFTTAWTGNWNLSLRTGLGGVNAGGTYHYRIAVYKIAGQ